MGFCHAWTFGNPLSEAQWEDLEAQAGLLIGALPALVTQRGQAMRNKGLLGRVQAALWAQRMRTPVRPGFPGGDFFGTSISGVRSIAIRPESDSEAGAQQVVVSNTIRPQWAKTGAHLYDRVLIGILCLFEATKPGAVTVDATDGDLEYWLHCRDWCAGVLGRPLPLPLGGRPLV